MDLLIPLLVLAILAVPIAGLVVGLIALSRARASAARADQLGAELAQLRRRVRVLERAAPAEGVADEIARQADETADEGLIVEDEVVEAPAPIAPPQPPSPPPSTASTASTASELPSGTVPAPPAPPPVRTEAPGAALTLSSAAEAPPAPPSATPPQPPRPPLDQPPAGPAAGGQNGGGVEWERWLGVRGAAVLAGILVALAGVYFVRYSIDAGWLSPTVRVALGLLAGLGALIGAEVLRTRGYRDTSNGLAGGGIVVLYAAVWAARALYGLIPTGFAFALMVLITAVCGLLASRHASLVVALLGLIGGFATPLLIQSGEDNPLGLFGYLLLLNVGLLFLSRKQGWPLIPPLGLVATLFYEAVWIFARMKPSELPLALVILTVFAALFVFALLRAVPAAASAGGSGAQPGEVEEAPSTLWSTTRAAAVLLPFAFAFYFALRADLGEHLWPVAAMLVILCVGAEMLRRRWATPGSSRNDLDWLGTAAAVASVAVVAVWALGRQATAYTAWELTAIAAALALAFHVFVELDLRRLARIGPGDPDPVSSGDAAPTPVQGPSPAKPAEPSSAGSPLRRFGGAGFAASGLLALLILDGMVDGAPFLLARAVGWGVLVALSVRQSALPGAYRRQAWAALALGATLPLFYRAHVDRPLLPGQGLPAPELYYGLVLLAAVAFQLLPALRRGELVRAWSLRAAQLFALGALVVFTVQVAEPSLPAWLALATPLALAVLTTLGATRLERPTGIWVLLAMGLAAFEHLLWAMDRPSAPGSPAAPHTLGLVAGAAGVLFFVAWPFLARPRLDDARWAWYAAALAGPAWFLSLGSHWEALWGDGALGALPIALGAVTLAATYRVRTLWSADDPRRLRGLVWFAAVALGFAALAIPLQLDREWVTIGWALEGVAVIALWRRLDHAGLKLFGLALLAVVAVRVVLLPPSGGIGAGWLAYTHLVPAAALLGAALLLEPLEVARLGRERALYPAARPLGAILCGLGGIVVGFSWVTRTVHVLFGAAPAALAGLAAFAGFAGRGATTMAHDLTLSIAWALYALLLLGLGFARSDRGLRGLGLGLMMITVFKLFLFDLSDLEDLYRVASLLGLGFSLVLVSLAYQRFVYRDGGTKDDR